MPWGVCPFRGAFPDALVGNRGDLLNLGKFDIEFDVKLSKIRKRSREVYGFLGPNGGSLAASRGSSTDTPGVAELVGSGQAALVVTAYLVGFAVLAGALLRRRDVV